MLTKELNNYFLIITAQSLGHFITAFLFLNELYFIFKTISIYSVLFLIEYTISVHIFTLKDLVKI